MEDCAGFMAKYGCSFWQEMEGRRDFWENLGIAFGRKWKIAQDFWKNQGKDFDRKWKIACEFWENLGIASRLISSGEPSRMIEHSPVDLKF